MRSRPLILPALDLLLVAWAWLLAFWFRFNLDIPEEFLDLLLATIYWPVGAYGVGLAAFRVHRQIWRYTSVTDLNRLAFAISSAALFTAAAILMMRYPSFPRSVLLLHPLLVALLLGAARAGWRTWNDRGNQAAADGKPLVVIGSIADVAATLGTLRASRQWALVGIVSPDPLETGRSLQGLPVLSRLQDLGDAMRKTMATTAVVAAAPGSAARREALMRASDLGVSLLTLPRPDEWLHAQGSTEPRKVELEDLLGRLPVQLDVAGLADLFSGQTVLVTGAGGSIGSELCRQIARFGVGRLVCVDVSEFAIYQLEQELRAAHPQMQGLYYTANVREAARLGAIAQRHRPAVVFHAAAYKHVPLMEDLNEIEALRTNVLGTMNVARMAGECGASRFVQVSTDKAVNPTNVMGASKRLAELVVQGVAREFAATQYVSVRFGNVLGSSGSVVPLFTNQIARGGPVTVTHPDIVRYFMTIPEAAQLVLQAGLMGQSGQIFVLDMGEPVKIVELARMLIRLSGKTEQDVPITYSGLRPGEKLFEELLANDETTEPTPHPKLRVAKTNGQQAVEMAALVHWIAEAGPAPSGTELRAWLRAQVPEYVAR
ncbi:polysaccharide biosynthesis protein [Variovorax terrae]|uniref:Polysaccharide biosynthesis protein n=1 Tax=Variovorax terrae TaxID=2923278 RepID=A0A9X2AMZ7_9BURK|nr:nucleoside-diphosphate sugar epimerase/dehydratase [Variovorax terrae]MCJ0764268.1 polysaccharide biosynthesis protein [Variovorax terrae]